jgi:hypothetical protein
VNAFRDVETFFMNFFETSFYVKEFMQNLCTVIFV